MLPANHTVLLNEIRKKQGRPIFALCRACGLAPADGATAKFYLLKHGYIMENNSTGGLFVINRNPEQVKAPVRILPPAENPYRVLRRNEPGAAQKAESTGLLTSEAKLQRQVAERQEEESRTETPAFQMAKPEPIVEKSLVEQIAEELRWHEQWEREQAELEAEESDEEIEGIEEDQPEETEDTSETPDHEESDEEEMANLGQTALQTLEKARVSISAETKPEPVQQVKTLQTPYGKGIPVPLTPGGKPMVNDDMILEYLTERGPATMAKITEYFGRSGSGLATKLSKMVKQNVISQRDKIPGQLIVYLTNADYLREVGSSMPKQILNIGTPVNVERESQLAVRPQTSAVIEMKAVEKVEVGDLLVKTEDGVKPLALSTPRIKYTEDTNIGVQSEHREPLETPTGPQGPSDYSLLSDENKEKYLRDEILRVLETGNKDVIMLACHLPNVPAADIHRVCGILNQRRRIIRAKDDELPEGYKLTQKKYKVWKLLDPNNRAARRSRFIDDAEILALFTGPDVVVSITEIATAFGRTPSGLGVTMNALCKHRKLVKCGDAPARYRLANVTLAAILEEIDKSFSVKTMVEQPDENWFPILNRLENLIGGDAGAVLAEIQAYLKRRISDD